MKRKIVYRIAELGGYFYPQQKINQGLFNKWECMFRSIPEFYLPSGDNVLPVIKFKTEKEAMDFIINLKDGGDEILNVVWTDCTCDSCKID
jgi:hypothetical protein